MSFLYPAFLVGAALIAIPVVLHLLRRDVAPEVPFTAVRLLKKSPIERTRRRRLRDLLLLAARVAAILLLAGAFARPYLTDASSGGPLRVIAVDRSYSMGAPGQFERAVERARAAIDAASLSERVALIAFDERADVVAAPGGASDARAALAELRPGYGGTRYGPVLTKAAELADGAQATLVLVTDLQRAGWEEQARAVLPEGFDVRIEDAGAPPPNLAVIAVRVEADGVVASIRNAGPRERGGDVRAVRDGQTVANARFTIPAESTADVPIGYRAPSTGSLTVAVDDRDGFAADNARFVLLDPVPRPAALVVTSAGDARSGFYLVRAIEAASRPGAGFEPRVATGAELAALPPESLSAYRVIVLLSTRGMDRRARGPLGAFVRGGGGLLVAASEDVDGSVLSMMLDWQPGLAAAAQPLAAGRLSATDLRHPIFRPFGGLAANLGQVRFDRSWRVRGDDWTVLARFSDGAPALLERVEGKGRVVLFASDFDRRWNDFPLHASFVPFAFETLQYAAGPTGDARDYVVARVPTGVRAEPGVQRLQNRMVAVNVDARESGVARITPEEFHEMLDRVASPMKAGLDPRAQQAEARQSYWRYALLLMLGVLVVESLIGKV
jgi:hypothetical protein